jgi:hypothetical protein
MEIDNRVAGRNAGQSEISTGAVVMNVSGVLRDEIYRSAPLTQNAHADWHKEDYRIAISVICSREWSRFTIRRISPAHALASSARRRETNTRKMIAHEPTTNTRASNRNA